MLYRRLKDSLRNIDFINDTVKYIYPPKNRPIIKAPNTDYIFICLHKVGGSSICKALGLPKRYHTAHEYIKWIGNINWQKVYKFSFVRNPFAKIVSSYNYFTEQNRCTMGENPISFENWVKKTYGSEKDPLYYFSEKWFQPQVGWLKDPKGEISLDKIGKLENMEMDFAEICNKIGIEVSIPHINSSKNVDYRTYYNEQTFDIVKNWHQEDLDTFGYNFDNGE